ncbi:MAG: YggT family protein [Chloroflexi bacterium]|nr:YggT family protein [Chloroflexota bacterium]
MCAPCLLIVFAQAFVNVFAGALTICILVRVLLSWVPVRLPLGLADLVFGVSETVLGPIRRALPAMGGLDLSPFIAVLAIQLVQGLLIALLPPPI